MVAQGNKEKEGRGGFEYIPWARKRGDTQQIGAEKRAEQKVRRNEKKRRKGRQVYRQVNHRGWYDKMDYLGWSRAGFCGSKIYFQPRSARFLGTNE
jgi:hypothetical protein